MYRSVTLTIQQMTDPAFRQVLLLSIGLTVGLLIAVWAVAFWLLGLVPDIEWRWLSWLNGVIDWVGGAGLIIGSVFLILPVSGLFIGLFLDKVAAAVELKHYADGPHGADQPFWAGVLSGLRLAGVMIVANLAMLFIALIPILNLFGIVLVPLVNAYLVSREFFEQAGHRLLSPADVAHIRRQRRVGVLIGGLIIFAVMLIPLVDILAPAFGTALMVHEFRRLAKPQLTGLPVA